MAGRGFNLRYLRYYLPQTLAQANWSGGICRDLPRSSIPPGFLYDCVDFMCDRPGMLYKRGGLTAFTNAAGVNTNAPSFIAAPTLNGTSYVFLKPADGNIYKYTSPSSSATSLGAFGVDPIDFPKVYPGASDILIVPAGDGTTAPKKVYISGGSPAIGDLAGSPPAGKYVAIHQNRAVIGGTAANPNRIYFSPAPNVEATWDTTNSFIDTTYPITSLVSVQGVLLVFSTGFCERIIGDIPPGLDGDNMTLQPLGAVGCSSPLSIQSWGNNVVFANAKGAWITNGAGFDSLTDKTNGTGITSLWTSNFSGIFNTLTSGLLNQKFYMVTRPNQTTQTLMCYLPTKSWWRLTNFNVYFAAGTPNFTGTDDVFFVGGYGSRGNLIMQMSSILTPALANVADFGALNVLPTLTTGMIGDGIGLKAYEHGHITYNAIESGTLADSALTVQYSKGLKAEDSFAAVPESPLLITSTSADLTQRKRFILNFDAQAIQMKLTGTRNMNNLEIFALETEVRDATYSTTSEFVNA